MGIRPWEHVHMTVEELDLAIDACDRHMKAQKRGETEAG